MSNFKDFDAYWAEQEQKPFEFKIFGQVEKLSSSLPAAIVLKLLRMQKDQDLSRVELLNMATSIFGDRIDKWCEKGLTMDQLADLLHWAMEQYNPGNQMPPVQGAVTE